jgi:predicted KAP-like P-loop ATPase
MAKAHGVGVDESVVAKVLLFERIGSPAANESLVRIVMDDPDGKPRFLAPWEEQAANGEPIQVDGVWDDPIVKEWLALPPRLSDTDLRGVMYVGREHAPLLTSEERLSSDGAGLLAALLDQPKMAAALKDKIKALPHADIDILTSRVLARAAQEQEWGTPPILEACIVLAEFDSNQATRVASFLSERPPAQIKANIVPRIAGAPWAADVLKRWAGSTVSSPVKNAIKAQSK